MSEYIHKSHNVTVLMYHLVFPAKYIRVVFDEEVDEVLKEVLLGHLKADHRMNRRHLKGADGDSLHAVLCAAGYNIRWLLRMIIKKGLSLFFAAVAGRGFDRLHRFAAQITRNLHRQSEQVRFHELGGGLKVDFSGTTTYADVAYLVEQFHYRPATTVEEGIKFFVAWYRDYLRDSI